MSDTPVSMIPLAVIRQAMKETQEIKARHAQRQQDFAREFSKWGRAKNVRPAREE